MRIGSAWVNASEESGKVYISISIDDAALPLVITKGKSITLWEIPEEERKKENSPHYSVSMNIPNKKEDKK